MQTAGFKFCEKGPNLYSVNQDYKDVLGLGDFQLLLETLHSPSSLGRGGAGFFTLKDQRRIVVRKFLRGGFLRHFIKEVYYGLPYRSFSELSTLVSLSKKGVNVPVPVAAFVQKMPLGLYRAALATEELPDTRNLLEVYKNLNDTLVVARRIGEQARACLEANVLPVDLHLGNVLLGKEDMPWLIDFDKAEEVRVPEKSKSRLLERWERSCDKHAAPVALKQGFLEALDGSV